MCYGIIHKEMAVCRGYPYGVPAVLSVVIFTSVLFVNTVLGSRPNKLRRLRTVASV